MDQNQFLRDLKQQPITTQNGYFIKFDITINLSMTTMIEQHLCCGFLSTNGTQGSARPPHSVHQPQTSRELEDRKSSSWEDSKSPSSKRICYNHASPTQSCKDKAGYLSASVLQNLASSGAMDDKNIPKGKSCMAPMARFLAENEESPVQEKLIR